MLYTSLFVVLTLGETIKVVNICVVDMICVKLIRLDNAHYGANYGAVFI